MKSKRGNRPFWLAGGVLALGAAAGAAWAALTVIHRFDLPSGSTGGGQSVALSGDTAVAGAPYASGGGRAYVFARTSSGWSSAQTLSGTASQTLVNAGLNQSVGTSAAIDGSRLVLGALGTLSNGADASAAYVFVRGSDGTWTQEARLAPSVANTQGSTGFSVDIEGDEVVAGAPYANASDGSVMVFRRQSGTWSQAERLDSPIGGTSSQTSAMGQSVSLSGDTLAAGAPAYGSEAGAVVVYERGSSGSFGSYRQVLTPTGVQDPWGTGRQQFGYSVAVSDDENTIVVGAVWEGDNGYLAPGALYVFTRDGSASPGSQWSQTARLALANSNGGELLGQNVALDGDLLLSGSGIMNTLYAFRRDSQGAWSLAGTATGTTSFESFGASVAARSGVVLAGAPGYSNFKGTAYEVIDFVDTTAPTLSMPSNIVAEATGPSGRAVTFSVTATDDTDASVAATCSPASGSTFPLGTTTVSCSATDASGNTATGSFTVTVADTTGPVLSAVTNRIAEATDATGAVVSFAAPSAADAVSGSRPVTCTPASGSTFPLGTTTVTCSATDAAGNSSSATFTVTVRDTTAPAVTVPAGITAEATSASGATVTFAPTATDAVTAAPAIVCSPASGTTFGLGTTTVTCTATDGAGNAASRTFEVTVVDTTGPVISVPADITLEATGPSGRVVTFAATATDAVSGTVSVTSSPQSGSTFAVGTTTVTCTATDGTGNQSSRTFRVTIADATPPVITSVTLSPGSLWPPNHQMVAIQWSASATDAGSAVPVELIGVTSNEPDNGTGDGDTAGDISLNTATGALSLRAERSGSGNGRVYTLTFRATDATGNSATTTRTVTVPKSKAK